MQSMVKIWLNSLTLFSNTALKRILACWF